MLDDMNTIRYTNVLWYQADKARSNNSNKIWNEPVYCGQIDTFIMMTSWYENVFHIIALLWDTRVLGDSLTKRQ